MAARCLPAMPSTESMFPIVISGTGNAIDSGQATVERKDVLEVGRIQGDSGITKDTRELGLAPGIVIQEGGCHVGLEPQAE